MKNTPIVLSAVFLTLFFTPRSSPAASQFDDINQDFHSDAGTIEFRLKLLKDISADPHNHVLFTGNSYERDEALEIQIIEDSIIVHRDFGQCVLTAFSGPYHFGIGEWHDLQFTWNRATSKFYIDGIEVPRVAQYPSDDLPALYPCIRLGHDSSFEIRGFRVSRDSSIYEDPKDRQFIKESACPHLNELLAEAPQERCRGVLLHHFPDQKSRDTIKSYIALLPDNFARAIRHVVFVDKKRASGRGEGGLADSQSMSIMLEEKYYSDPKTFFHEAAHLYDYTLQIALGVPEEKNEWAAISGVSCYYHGADMQGYAKNLEKNMEKNAFLTGQGGQCSFEDLAIWVGAVYDNYIAHKTFKDMLDPVSPRYNAKTKRKLDFLLKKGFFTQEVYDKVTAQ